jgi:hypothetical protein
MAGQEALPVAVLGAAVVAHEEEVEGGRGVVVAMEESRGVAPASS